MTTITQNGYNFIYRNTRRGQLPVVETWSVERVAAFIFLVEFHRRRTYRCVHNFTFVSRYGSIQYELEEFDTPTFHDVDKLTKILLPYIDNEFCTMFYTSFDKGLDLAEKILRDKVSSKEAPQTVMGVSYEPARFYERPTREEYEEKAYQEQQALQSQVSDFEGKTIKVWFYNYGIIPCVVTRESNCYYWVNGFLGDTQVIEGARIKKGTSRIITD